MAYSKTTWVTGDVITAEKLNNIENKVEELDGASGDVEQVRTELTAQIEGVETELSGSIDALDERVAQAEAAVGAPMVASTVAGMTDHTKVYVYTGSETGYTSGNWYYWNGSAWTSGGVYNAVAVDTDKTLSVANKAADGKKVGDEISELKSDINNVEDVLEDIGVEGGKIELPIITTWGKYITGQGVIDTAAGNNGVSVGNVTPETTYYISASASFTQPYFAWYNDNMELVELGTLRPAGSTVTSIVDATAICPSGATKIGIAQISSGQLAGLKIASSYSLPALDNVVDQVDNLVDQVDNLVDDLGGYIDNIVDVPITNTPGRYINNHGIITETGGNYVIAEGAVEAGEKYLITASTNYTNPFYAWYDANNTLISIGSYSASGGAYSTLIDFEAIAPTGATKIVINWNTASISGVLRRDIGKRIAKKWYGKKWACVGDSLTDNNQYTTKHYFDYVKDATDIEPINMGDSGTGYKRGEDTNRAFYQRISGIDTTADVVTIFGSFNDIGAGYTLGTYTDTDTTTIAGCINATLDNLQAVMPTAILGIVAPTPWATARPDFHIAADNYVNILKQIAEHRSIPFLDLYRHSNLRPWDADFRELAYSNDGGNGTHPNELGQKIIAPKFEGFLYSLLLS